MNIRKVNQILTAFADSHRLRIINLLNEKELNVAEICQILHSTQSNVSKHLTRLRLTGIVRDKRRGRYAYYYLIKPGNKFYTQLLGSITEELGDLEIFKKDIEKLRKIERKPDRLTKTKRKNMGQLVSVELT